MLQNDENLTTYLGNTNKHPGVDVIMITMYFVAIFAIFAIFDTFQAKLAVFLKSMHDYSLGA
jgi:hypothetical protein